MPHRANKVGNSKLSTQFAKRLSRLKPADTVRVMVLLRLPDESAAPDRRQSRAKRQAALASLRSSAEAGVNAVDNILRSVGGQRLSASADALGSLAVETTPGGVNELSESEHVKAILEDQGISSLPKPK